ncbi:MAG: glycogen/starch/alpha-glucan phosphorylase [Cyclobacteriaceae bacterium]|nr:glycogen/starch/alpha-glucan phosphorylase [Cyclobacteriaceae bacterium]
MKSKPAPKHSISIEDDRTGTDIETLKRAFLDNLFYVQGKFPEFATRNDYYLSLAYVVRDRLLHRWLNTIKTYSEKHCRKVSYLSAEFLMGPHLGNNLINMGLYDQMKKAMNELGLNLEELIDQEEEPGLGNGGLGRLAACFLDSLATLNIPAFGFGIRYEYGIFEQEIRDGWQVEKEDKWLKYGNPWEIARVENTFEVKFGGYTESGYDEHGKYRVTWIPAKVVKGIPYDTPVLGYDTDTAATLRLWQAEAFEPFDFQTFNMGDFYGAVDEKVMSENITKVLYPNDEQISGKQLRLEQQYFFVSCTLQDLIRYHLLFNKNLDNFHKKNAIQLNDTHPSIAVADFMRLLIDIHGMSWDQAWAITQSSFNYTNHTLLPEALEKWPIGLMHELLPRHMEIIYEINHHFLEKVRQSFPGDEARITRMSIIDETGEKYVRMAHLACVGSNRINGVAALHTKLIREELLKDFNDLWPDKILNVTNGVTPRRWVVLNNPQLTELITDNIGSGWIRDLDQLKKLEPLAEDANFRKLWRKSKLSVKSELATTIEKNLGIRVDPGSMFDIQVKRIHEYKRQHLNVLHIITLFNRIKENPEIDMVPRTFIFGGKAAPGYFMAKLIIKLINGVKEVINSDQDVKDRLKVVFIPDYSVKNSQHVYPAADLSEQISTAGKEASGTGNMKFSMNGALTIGTLDGANIEIREEVGEENFFLFGLTADEVKEKRSAGYLPFDHYHSDPELKKALDLIASGYFSEGNHHLFQPLTDSLLYYDHYMLLADYQSYIECQDRVSAAYRNIDNWTRMSILNTARTGKFSSDRSILDYTREIWKTDPVKVEAPPYHPDYLKNKKFRMPDK